MARMKRQSDPSPLRLTAHAQQELCCPSPTGREGRGSGATLCLFRSAPRSRARIKAALPSMGAIIFYFPYTGRSNLTENHRTLL